MIYLDEEEKDHIAMARIKVVGIGGAGGNAINCMIESGFKGADFYAINTDAQALKLSLAGTKIQIGLKSTKGLGAGANPEVGKRAAEEDLDKVLQELSDADIIFVTAGMGGGTGSGALPVIVQALKERGILTIVIVTKPFSFEGKRRARITEQALERIKTTADTLLIIPNQKLLDVADDSVSMIDGFSMINEVLNQSVRGISEIITRSGHINVDFADVREIMKDKGLAVMGTARATGQGRAKKAALDAISSPLLENMSIAGARAVLINITGGTDLGLHEISEAASVIYEQVDEEANIILGSVIDTDMGNEISVTIIATDFNHALSCKIEDKPVALASMPHIIPTSMPRPLPVQKQVEEVQSAPVYAQPIIAQPVAQEVVQPQVFAQAAPVYAQPVYQQPAPQPIIYQQPAPQPVVYHQPELQVAPVEQPAPITYVEKIAAIQQIAESTHSPLSVREDLLDDKNSCILRQLTEEQEIALLFEKEVAELEALELKKEAVVPAEKVESLEVQKQQSKPAEIELKAEQQEHKQESSTSQAGSIDINDLDVPTFMRKQVKEKQRTE